MNSGWRGEAGGGTWPRKPQWPPIWVGLVISSFILSLCCLRNCLSAPPLPSCLLGGLTGLIGQGWWPQSSLHSLREGCIFPGASLSTNIYLKPVFDRYALTMELMVSKVMTSNNQEITHSPHQWQGFLSILLLLYHQGQEQCLAYSKHFTSMSWMSEWHKELQRSCWVQELNLSMAMRMCHWSPLGPGKASLQKWWPSWDSRSK